MVPCIIVALYGSSRLMVTGPANAISLTTMALVAPLAAVGSPEYVRLVLTLTFMVGALQLLLGICRFGRWIERMPHSVVAGFTAGAAILIVNSQVGTLLGVPLPAGLSVAGTLQGIAGAWRDIQWLPLTTASVTILIAVLAQRRARRIPPMLTAAVGGAAFAWLVVGLSPTVGSLATVQELPGALPPLSMPDLSPQTLVQLSSAALVMTLLALAEAMAIAKAVARRTSDPLDGNHELVGQGLANVAGAFFSAYPASGSFNRSGVNVAAGARTPLAAASAAVFLTAILLFAAPLARYLPLAVIAGLLFVVAAGLIQVRELNQLWQEERCERAALVITFVATVTISLEWAILLGLLAAAAGRSLAAARRPLRTED